MEIGNLRPGTCRSIWDPAISAKSNHERFAPQLKVVLVNCLYRPLIGVRIPTERFSNSSLLDSGSNQLTGVPALLKGQNGEGDNWLQVGQQWDGRRGQTLGPTPFTGPLY